MYTAFNIWVLPHCLSPDWRLHDLLWLPQCTAWLCSVPLQSFLFLRRSTLFGNTWLQSLRRWSYIHERKKRHTVIFFSFPCGMCVPTMLAGWNNNWKSIQWNKMNDVLSLKCFYISIIEISLKWVYIENLYFLLL